MLIPGALTTLNNAKAHIGITDSDSDAMLEIYINGFSQYAAKYIGRVLELQTDKTFTIDGNDGERLYLPVAPIVNITAVTQDGVAVVSGDYMILNETGVLRRKSGIWAKGIGNIEVTGDFGYAMANDKERTQPYDLELACLKAVGAVFNKRDAEGAQSASSGGMNVNWAKVIKDEDIVALLALYKDYSIIGA